MVNLAKKYIKSIKLLRNKWTIYENYGILCMGILWTSSGVLWMIINYYWIVLIVLFVKESFMASRGSSWVYILEIWKVKQMLIILYLKGETHRILAERYEGVRGSEDLRPSFKWFIWIWWFLVFNVKKSCVGADGTIRPMPISTWFILLKIQVRYWLMVCWLLVLLQLSQRKDLISRVAKLGSSHFKLHGDIDIESATGCNIIGTRTYSLTLIS